MAVRRDCRKNSIKTTWRVIFAKKFALTYWRKASVLFGVDAGKKRGGLEMIQKTVKKRESG